ncbi:spermidine synthase [Pasteurella canis]|uniref:Spermidine synthase n=1 Tax=Pasteurella canis TaxID=753 RepID=A0A379ETX7_9PAST|nr:fused MFS/spermidine synthase [Pasteurella canis]SUC09830.1 spermidine synthase [Pasteurella canis]
MKNGNLNIIKTIFFLSGFAALIYQIAWQRLLFTAFGVDLESITIIIAVFMAGLGIGAYCGGRIADKYPQKIVLIFALAELGIGAFGFASPTLIELVKNIFLYSNISTIALANFLLLLFPTFLMGSTLPLLTQHLNRYVDNIGNNIGWLYFVNTLGASSACIMTGFFLFSYFDLEQVIYIAGAINSFIAFVIFLLYRNTGNDIALEEESYQMTKQAEVINSTHHIIQKAVILSFVGGFLSLSLEVIWIRLFSFYSASIPQAFSIILALFLLGIAFGSYIGKKVCQMGQASIDYIGKVFVVAAFFDLFILVLISHASNRAIFILGVFIIALLRGIVFPIVHHLGSENKKTGAAISNVYFANVLGCTLAPIFIGFYLLDLLNTQQTYFVIILCTFVIAYFCLAHKTLKRVSLSVALFSALCIFLPDNIIRVLSEKDNLLTERIIENKHGLIQVYANKDNEHIVYGSNVYDGMLNIDIDHNTNGIHRAYLLSAIAPEAKKVLVVGLSTGSWVSVLASMPHLESITVVELNPAYPLLANSYPEMAKILKDRRINIVTDDGRRWLTKNKDEKFDFILMNTTFHWRSYATNLLSQDFLELTKQHLNNNGFVYFNTTGSLDALFTTQQVYPYTYKYVNMALGSLKPVTNLTEEQVSDALTKLTWQDGKKVFTSAEKVELGTKIILNDHIIPYKDIDFSSIKRPLEVITDRNMITEYKYGILSLKH